MESGIYDDFCGICGFALEKHKQQVTLVCDGIDFFTHDRVKLEMTVCPECWSNLMEVAYGGMAKAVQRRVDFDLDALGQRDEMKKRKGVKHNFKKRDDEDGGVAPKLPPP